MPQMQVFDVEIPDPKNVSCHPGGDEPASWDRAPKINMEPQSEGLEDGFPFQRAVLQVPC